MAGVTGLLGDGAGRGDLRRCRTGWVTGSAGLTAGCRPLLARLAGLPGWEAERPAKRTFGGLAHR